MCINTQEGWHATNKPLVVVDGIVTSHFVTLVARSDVLRAAAEKHVAFAARARFVHNTAQIFIL